MIYTTHYYLNDQRWSGQRLNAINWKDAEYQANIKGLHLTGELIQEIPCNNDGNNNQWPLTIDYDKINNLEEYKNIKTYTADLQLTRLELITDFVVYEYQIDRAELFSTTRKRLISEARRKIAFLARMFYNIEGKIIANYLNMNNEWVCQLIYTAWDYCSVDVAYYEEIQKLMVKLQMHHNVTLKPLF